MSNNSAGQLAFRVIAFARMNKSAGFNGYDREPEKGSIYEQSLSILNCKNDEQPKSPAISPVVGEEELSHVEQKFLEVISDKDLNPGQKARRIGFLLSQGLDKGQAIALTATRPASSAPVEGKNSSGIEITSTWLIEDGWKKQGDFFTKGDYIVSKSDYQSKGQRSLWFLSGGKMPGVYIDYRLGLARQIKLEQLLQSPANSSAEKEGEMEDRVRALKQKYDHWNSISRTDVGDRIYAHITTDLDELFALLIKIKNKEMNTQNDQLPPIPTTIDGQRIERYYQLKLAELRSEIRELKDGQHADEIRPRAETWLKERENWQNQVDRLRNHIATLAPKGGETDKKEKV